MCYLLKYCCYDSYELCDHDWYYVTENQGDKETRNQCNKEIKDDANENTTRIESCLVMSINEYESSGSKNKSDKNKSDKNKTVELKLWLRGNTRLAQIIESMDSPIVLIKVLINIVQKFIIILEFRNVFTQEYYCIGHFATTMESRSMKNLGTLALAHLLQMISDGKFNASDKRNGDKMNVKNWSIKLYACGHIPGKDVENLYRFYHSIGFVFDTLSCCGDVKIIGSGQYGSDDAYSSDDVGREHDWII